VEPTKFFYNCSREYLDTIDSALYLEIANILKYLPRRSTRTDINNDFFWLLAD